LAADSGCHGKDMQCSQYECMGECHLSLWSPDLTLDDNLGSETFAQ